MEYEKYDKPVKYDENFLQQIAEKYHKCKLVGEKHHSKKIGVVHSISYSENGLDGIIDTKKNTDGKSYSPMFKSTLVDKGNYYLAIDGELKEISLTANPRLPLDEDYFLNNKNNKDDKMGDKNNNVEDVLSKQVQELNKKNAMLENKLKVAEKKVNEYDKLVKEHEELKKSHEEQAKQLEESKPIVEKYNNYLEKTKENLLETISNGNDEVKNKYKNMVLEDLKLVKEAMDNSTQIHDKDPRGISSDDAQNAGLNTPQNKDKNQEVNPEESLKETAKFFNESRGMVNPYATE